MLSIECPALSGPVAGLPFHFAGVKPASPWLGFHGLVAGGSKSMKHCLSYYFLAKQFLDHAFYVGVGSREPLAFLCLEHDVLDGFHLGR